MLMKEEQLSVLGVLYNDYDEDAGDQYELKKIQPQIQIMVLFKLNLMENLFMLMTVLNH